MLTENSKDAGLTAQEVEALNTPIASLNAQGRALAFAAKDKISIFNWSGKRERIAY